MAAFMEWWLACLILGHVAFGRRWMIDGTRGIVAAWADMYRWARRKLTVRGGA